MPAPVIVAIGGKNYPMRWEIGPARRAEEESLGDNGVYVAWEASIYTHRHLTALWAMSLRCKDGIPNLSEDDAEALLQAFIDEGHVLNDARVLVGQAGIAGGFLSEVPGDADTKATGGDGTD